ncbi:MAG: S9 family peptidase [Acidobacteriota bacterium]|nr:MAG: S9 family peptidase [Acidobacteriota bacterium]
MNQLKNSFRIKAVVLLLALLAAPLFAQQLTVKEIMAEPSIAGMRIQSEQLSPDGKKVVFLWNAEGKQPLDLYLAATDGSGLEKWLSPREIHKPKEEEQKEEDANLEYGVVVNDEFEKVRRGQFGNLRWSPDSSKVLFTIGGDLYVIGLGETKPKRITKTESGEFAAQFLDNDRIIFQQSGNIFVIDTKDATLVQLSKEANSQKQISVGGANPSEDGSVIAYVTSDGSKQRSLYVPNYLPYYTAAPAIRRGWSTQELFIAKTDGSLDESIKVELPKPEGESYFYGIEWTSDNKVLIVDRVDKTHKRRQIYAVTYGEKESSAYLVHEETDDKWIGGPSRILEASPSDPSKFFFGSEKDGWHHLYLVGFNSSKFKEGKANADVSQLTNGAWQVEWAEWTADGRQIALMSTEESPRWREFYLVDPGSGKKTKVGAGPAAGMMKNSPQMESGRFVFEASNVVTPGELYSIDVSGEVRKLTSTIPDDFTLYKFKSPSFTEIRASDGKMIPAKIYLPDGFSKSRKYPMAIFVHGAGYLQNVINGWNNYYREFMFNEMLRRKGYVVLDIDYRGSAGYGRDWRTDVYDFLGGKDYTDHIDAIDHMVREYSVDVNRIGTYGGSYGGFMAAMLVMRSPDKIAAAAALRPVMDWKNYYATNPFYTSQRLGDPKKNPEAYKRSSPISYADQLRKKLLILHGLVDSNVHAQDSIQLVEQLIRLDKTEHFDLMLYPAENHGFERPASWEDEYERILALFEKELNPQARAQ